MFISHEYSDLGPMSVEELSDVVVPDGHELVYIEVPGQQPDVAYESEVTHFPVLDERNAGIHISTAQRGTYLEHGSEKDAQTALVRLTAAVRQISGGVIDVSANIGAISNNILNPVCMLFRKKPGEIILPDDRLGMGISLVSNGGVFSDTISDDARELPLTFAVPSPEADRFLANLILANRTNPNQNSKDLATANGHGQEWQAEFDYYNPPHLLEQEPMKVTPGSVALLMSTLETEGIFTGASATVRIRRPEN